VNLSIGVTRKLTKAYIEETVTPLLRESAETEASPARRIKPNIRAFLTRISTE
jgi:hypothetical protein